MSGTEIPTDLLTPLGAYLSLREGARGAFLLESVERGRLGRYSFVGAGSRLVSFEEAETLGEPVVGYLGYDAVATFEPTVRLPERRAGRAGEPLARPGRAAALRPRARCRGAAARRGAGRRAAAVAPRHDPARADRARAFARRAPAPRRARTGAHPRGRRLPGRDRPARDAPDLGVGRRALPGAAPRQPVAVPLPAGARHGWKRLRRLPARAGGQLARDGRQVRRPPRRAEPDRGDDRSRRRRCRDAALVGEGPRRAHDARRPRPQRPLARLRAGVGAGRAVHGARALLARDAPRLGGRRRAARRDHAVRAAARDLPGRHRLGRAEGARDADHLGARAVPARHLRRGCRSGYVAGRRRRGWRSTRASRSARSGCGTASPTCRREAASSPTRIPPPSTRSASPSCARSKRRSTWQSRSRTRRRDSPHRQLRLVLVQPRAPVRRARCGGRRAAERRARRRRGGAAGSLPARRLARARPSGGRGRDAAIVERLLPTTPTLGVCLGHQALVEACGGEVGYARELVHGKASPVRHDGSGLFTGLPDPFEAGRYHSLAATRLPDVLEPTAFADDGEVMAVRHRELPAVGVQFHPESVLTPDGPALARNFLEGRCDPALARAAARRPRPLARRGARDDGGDHGRRGDAGADRRLPRRAAGEGRDGGRDRRLRRGDARARPARQPDAHRSRRRRRHRRRRREHVQHLDRRGPRHGGGRSGRREARQPRRLVADGRRGRARGARLPSSSCRRSGSSARSTSSASASSSRRRTIRRCGTRRPSGASSRRVPSSTCSDRSRTRPARAPSSSASTRRSSRGRSPTRSSSSTSTRAYVVHGAGGIDELSPCGPNLVCEVAAGHVREYELDPLDLGIERCDPDELRGGDPQTNAAALRDVLARRGRRPPLGRDPQRRRRDRRGQPGRRHPRGPRAGARGDRLRRGRGAARRARGVLARMTASADALCAARGFGAIAEFKRRSPSTGDIRPGRAGRGRRPGIRGRRSARRLGARRRGVRAARSTTCARRARRTDLPLLAKGFFSTEEHLRELREAGADAALLILRDLDDATAARLMRAADELGLDTLVEAHDDEELERATRLGARVIGVNARDLGTFRDRPRRAARARGEGAARPASWSPRARSTRARRQPQPSSPARTPCSSAPRSCTRPSRARSCASCSRARS